MIKMKKIKMLLLIVGIFSSLNIYAESVCKENHGTLRCESGSIKNIDYIGFVDINNTIVEGRFHVLGNANIKNANLNSIEVRGGAHLDKTKVSGLMKMVGNVNGSDINVDDNTEIVGDFYASHAIMSSNVSIVGSVECDYCVFKKEATLIGDVNVKHSEFLRPIQINIKNSSFSHSKINDITIKKSSDRHEQVIKLKNGSSVHDITFEDQRGLVIVSDNSVITGTVQGGKVIIEK